MQMICMTSEQMRYLDFGDIRMKSFPETTRVEDSNSIKKKMEDHMKSILFVIVIHWYYLSPKFVLIL